MIFTYGTSIQGDDHVKWDNTPCQDANRIETLENGWVIAAVADGVGSAKNSQDGSRIAVDTVVDFCIENMPFNGTTKIKKEDVLALLKIGYFKAFKNIIELSQKTKEPLNSYDTTLDVVIYNGNTLLYGHCSDGGIIVLGDLGEYEVITTRMKGEDGESMIPLRFTEEWEFNSYDFPVSSVMIFTDGVFDFVDNKKLEINWTTPLYVNVLKNFSSPQINGKPIKKVSDLTSELDEFMKKDFWKVVSDDKTVVTLINLDKNYPVSPNPHYYDEPDWKKIDEKINAALYPSASKGSTTGEDYIIPRIAQKKDEQISLPKISEEDNHFANKPIKTSKYEEDAFDRFENGARKAWNKLTKNPEVDKDKW